MTRELKFFVLFLKLPDILRRQRLIKREFSNFRTKESEINNTF